MTVLALMAAIMFTGRVGPGLRWPLWVILLCCGLVGIPTASSADRGDCGQPVSTGASPKTSDAQTVLKAAVGQATACDAKPCICDTNGNGRITVDDALRHLRFVVGLIPCPVASGLSGIPCGLLCNCPPFDPPCTSARITSLVGSEIDVGWTGLTHDSDLLVGPSMNVRVKRECSGATPDVECLRDEDCVGNGACEATCNCNTDTSCEISGPTGSNHCRSTLVDCEINRCMEQGIVTETACHSNADCGNGTCTGSAACSMADKCVSMPAPPQPFVAGASEYCVVSMFDGPLTGTADAGTGEARLSVNVAARIYQRDHDGPCPICGPPGMNPEPGDVFTCDGGKFPGAACTVDGVSTEFGGTSFDCPPASINSSSVTLRLGEVTTGASTKIAGHPCGDFPLTANPLVPGSNPKCLDKQGNSDPNCTSNADCTRCTLEDHAVCATNNDCVGKGVCAEAPDQPITCGYWCHCGSCEGDPQFPCFSDTECPAEKPDCVASSGPVSTVPTQDRANGCEYDNFVCGSEAKERCESSVQACSPNHEISCVNNSDCESFGDSKCEQVVTEQSCFESRIGRSGAPSPLGTYCAFEDRTCSANTDCATPGDFCVEDSARPKTVALFCAPSTGNPFLSRELVGVTGPAAVSMNSFVQVCRCGDSRIGCDEDCDDGNINRGDGCDDLCQEEIAP